MKELENWFKNQNWENVRNVTSAHEKATVLQSTCMEALDKHLPTKTVTFTNDDSPWITPQIKTEIRKRKREYTKHRRSTKWHLLNEKVVRKIK